MICVIIIIEYDLIFLGLGDRKLWQARLCITFYFAHRLQVPTNFVISIIMP